VAVSNCIANWRFFLYRWFDVDFILIYSRSCLTMKFTPKNKTHKSTEIVFHISLTVFRDFFLWFSEHRDNFIYYTASFYQPSGSWVTWYSYQGWKFITLQRLTFYYTREKIAAQRTFWYRLEKTFFGWNNFNCKVLLPASSLQFLCNCCEIVFCFYNI
jgi:hypothetical protein